MYILFRNSEFAQLIEQEVNLYCSDFYLVDRSFMKYPHVFGDLTHAYTVLYLS